MHFLEDPAKSPYTQYTSGRNGIEEKKYNTTEYKDYLISDKFDDSRDNKGDFFDTSARDNLRLIQQAHSDLTHAIKVNENNLSRIDKAAKNPNLGKDLSNSDKVELGGTSSGGLIAGSQIIVPMKEN